MDNKKNLEGERVRLRMFTEGDEAFLIALLNSPGFINFIGDRNVHDIKAAQSYITTKLLPPFEKDGYGMWLVELKDGSIPIGTCGLVNREEVDGYDLGFALHPDYYRQGYSFEASRVVIDYIQGKEGFEKLSAIVNNDNRASISLLNKLGFEYMESIRLKNGDRVNLMLKKGLGSPI